MLVPISPWFCHSIHCLRVKFGTVNVGKSTLSGIVTATTSNNIFQAVLHGVTVHLREEQLRPGAVHELADEGVLDEGLVRQVLSHLLLHQEGVLQLRSVPAAESVQQSRPGSRYYEFQHFNLSLRYVIKDLVLAFT